MLALLTVLFALTAHASEPSRLLVEADRRVDRADYEVALDKLKAVDATALDPADRAWWLRMTADAHRQAALDKGTADPAFHLDKSYEAHAQCMQATAKGTASHRRQCTERAPELTRAIEARSGLLLTILELGGAAAPSEAAARCDQLGALVPKTLTSALCEARLAWARKDVERAESALTRAIERIDQARDGEFDGIAARALSTPLNGLGDIDKTQELLSLIPQTHRDGVQVQRILKSLDRYKTSLEPRKTAAYSDNSLKSWTAWVRGLTEAGLDALAVTEAEEAAKRFPDDPALHEIIAITFINASARLPPYEGPARLDRMRRQRTWLTRAQQAATQCSQLKPDHPRCGARASTLAAQITQLQAQLQ
ncbi:MAG: hypothetical protein AB8H79_10570 [Myxococcota bacterium]